MAVANKTFGDFFDEVAKTEFSEAKYMWLPRWVNSVDAAKWVEVRAGKLTDNLIVCFAEDMVTAIQQRMASIDTDGLYASTFKTGKAFLQEVKTKAQQFGVDVSAQVDVPITPSDAIARAQGVEIEY